MSETNGRGANTRSNNQATRTITRDRRTLRRHSFAALIVAAIAMAPSCAAHQRDDVMDARSIEKNKAVVREFFRVFSTGNAANTLALMRDDATYWVSGSVQGFSGLKKKPELAKVLSAVGDLYVGGALVLTPSTMIAEGDLVFADASGRAELKNGRVYEPHSAWVFRVDDGRIVEIKEFIDTLHSTQVFLANEAAVEKENADE